MIGYHVSGWMRHIAPQNRTSANRSDGAIFSRRHLAEQFAKQHLAGCTIVEVENPTPADVDYLIRAGIFITPNSAPDYPVGKQ